MRHRQHGFFGPGQRGQNTGKSRFLLWWIRNHDVPGNSKGSACCSSRTLVANFPPVHFHLNLNVHACTTCEGLCLLYFCRFPSLMEWQEQGATLYVDHMLPQPNGPEYGACVGENIPPFSLRARQICSCTVTYMCTQSVITPANSWDHQTLCADHLQRGTLGN